jgi:hypothetical protein
MIFWPNIFNPFLAGRFLQTAWVCRAKIMTNFQEPPLNGGSGDKVQSADAIEGAGIDAEHGQIAAFRAAMVLDGSRSRNCGTEDGECTAEAATTVFGLDGHDDQLLF